jgi:hypothetical protein
MSSPPRRSLTPLTGELTDTFEPARPPRKRRLPRLPRLPTPTSWTGAIAIGIARFLIVVALLAGLAAGLALLALWLTEASPARAFMLAFIGLGAFIILGGFFSSAADMGTDYYYDVEERQSRLSSSFVYVAVGATLLATGLVLESVA